MKKTKKPLSIYQKVEKKFLTRLTGLYKQDKEAKKIFNSLSKGKTSFLRVDRLESSSYDLEWLEKIEDTLQAISNIIQDPKKTIKTVGNIVPVELAKKTTAESVIHLSSHSQYVKNITPDGEIIPDKILSMSAEDEYGIYENKFVATLIKTLLIFVEKRYEYVQKYAALYDQEILYYKNSSIVDGSEVEIETKIKVSKNSQQDELNGTNTYVERIEKVREYAKYFYSSSFMKMFKNEKDVRSPIIMTNILRKNPDYHKCYSLYKFIEKYNKLGINYNIDENYHNFTKKEMHEMNNFIFANFLALKGDNPSKKPIAKEKTYTPKMLKTMDDEIFIFSPISNKPIEFIRVDQQYRTYLNRLKNPPLKKEPVKEEKIYLEKEYEEKKEVTAENKALRKLEIRKRKEEEKFLKKQEALLEKQKKLEEQQRIKEEKAREAAKRKRLQEIRKQIREAALEDRKEEDDYVQNHK